MATMKDLAALLGVEIGEEFEINCNSYRFTDTALECSVLSNWVVSSEPNLIPDLFSGKRRIIKKPWKPKQGDTYFTASPPYCVVCTWCDRVSDKMLYAIGNCFRTRDEAEKHRDEILAKLNEIYDSGKPLLEW